MVARSVGIKVTDIGIEEVPEHKSKVKPLKYRPRGRSRWKSIRSTLMAMCRFSTLRSPSSLEPAESELNNMRPSNTKVGIINMVQESPRIQI